jgi:16S rRNA (cytosine1402-N4)-methyltransferase
MENRHVSVLLQESIDALQLEASDVVVDGTIGGAGHFAALRESLGTEGTLIGIDADDAAITRAEALPPMQGGPSVHLINDNFRNLGSILDTLGIETIDKSLFDLGWSSFHLSSGRGFSFQAEQEPLLMTYGTPEEGKTAADMVNTASEEALADLFYSLGEERFARPIARSIVRVRSQKRILTTGDLVEAVLAGTPGWYHRRRIHPATKTFQALRIAVNDELGAVRDGLTTAIERTRTGGRIAVITFHSIEDRIVKSMFRDAAYAGKGTLVTKKPLAPSSAELVANPRARSAKLRVFECGDVAPTPSALTQTLYVYA